MITAATFRDGLEVAGIVLNEPVPRGNDASQCQNAAEIRRRAVAPLLAELGFDAGRFDPPVDWFAAAREPTLDRQTPQDSAS